MRNADKIIIALLILLFIGAGYFQYVTDELNKRMDIINKVDQKLVDKVEDEFADSLKHYNLRFIGRGKHLRQAQLDIVSNTDLINKNTDSLSSLIDNVDFKLDNFMRETNRNFKNVIIGGVIGGVIGGPIGFLTGMKYIGLTTGTGTLLGGIGGYFS